MMGRREKGRKWIQMMKKVRKDERTKRRKGGGKKEWTDDRKRIKE